MKKIFVLLIVVAIVVTVILAILQADESFTPIEAAKCPHGAIVVMDLQKDFIGDEAKYPVDKSQVEPMLKAVNSIVKSSKSLNLEVIYIDTKFSKDQWITNWFRNYAAIEETEGVDLDERLLVQSKRLFTKKKQNAFTNNEFAAYLRERAIGKLVICGVFADKCVSATARAAKKRGYSVTVVSDGIAAGNQQAVTKTVRYLKRKGINFKSSADLLSESN